MHQTALKEQHENWKAARARLFHPAVKVKPVAAEPTMLIEVKAAPSPIKVPPLWTWADIHFDWHVRVWRETLDATVSQLAHENAALRAALRVAEIDADCGITLRRPIKEIVADILVNFPGITWEDIKGHHRSVDVVYPRHLCMYEVFKQRRDMSYPLIAKHFGGRDHTTVINAVNKISGMSEKDHQRELARQRKFCKKRRRYARARIMEIEALQAAAAE